MLCDLELLAYRDALRAVHAPRDEDEQRRARERLAFQVGDGR